MPHIYVSAYGDDLAPFRSAAEHIISQLNYQTITQRTGIEHHQTDEPHLANDLKPIDQCVAYIGIIAWRYGAVPNDLNPEAKSITELAYLRASARGLPCFIYLLDETAPWPMIYVDTDRTKVDQFRQAIKASTEVEFVRSADDLDQKLWTALNKWTLTFKTSMATAHYNVQSHAAKLKEKADVLNNSLRQADQAHRIEALQQELRIIQNMQADLGNSYEQAVMRKQRLIFALQQIQQSHPGDNIDQAVAEAKNGNIAHAKRLLLDAVKKTEEVNRTGAMSAYQYALIAQDELDYPRAKMYFEKAVRFQPENHQYRFALGQWFKIVGQYAQALKHHTQAYDLRCQSEQTDTSLMIESLSNIGEIYQLMGQQQTALTFYEKSLELVAGRDGRQSLAYAERLSFLGLFYAQFEQYRQAIETHQHSLEIRLRFKPESDPQIAECWINLATCYEGVGETERAIHFYELALTQGILHFGEQHPEVALRRNNLGLAYHALGESAKAIELIRLALESDLASFGQDHPEVSTDYHNLGLIYDKLCEYDKAIEYFQRALHGDAKTYGEDHPNLVIVLNSLAAVYLSLAQPAQALHYYQRSYQILKNELGHSHAEVKQLAALMQQLEQ